MDTKKLIIIFLILLGICSLVFAEGPIKKNEDTNTQLEFDNVYQDLRNMLTRTISSSLITGTTTNDSAIAGRIGEAKRANQTTSTSFDASGVYKDLVSISISSGDWSVSGVMLFDTASGISPFNSAEMVISNYSGNATTDHIIADNWLTTPGSTTSMNVPVSIPDWQFSTARSTTVYLKGSANYGGTAPRMRGRISARRMR